jgi:hypothetical protein
LPQLLLLLLLLLQVFTTAALNTTQFWDIINLTPDAVPVHLHNTDFRVSKQKQGLVCQTWDGGQRAWGGGRGGEGAQQFAGRIPDAVFMHLHSTDVRLVVTDVAASGAGEVGVRGLVCPRMGMGDTTTSSTSILV